MGNTFYRYSINGQENTPEIAPNTTTAEFWQYDARLARRWNLDPAIKEFESPYAAFANNPIWNIDPSGADTAKYLTNSQLAAAVKIAFNVIDKDVKLKKYNASNDRSSELNQAMQQYWNEHKDGYSFPAASEFQNTMHQYYKGFTEVATRSSTAWDRLGQRINNNNISDATNVHQAAATIHAYNGSTQNLVTDGANVAMGTAAGAVGTSPGVGPRGTRINSARQQEIVNIGIRNSVPKNIHDGQQGKHIVGHNNYEPGKSILTTDAQALLNQFHAGKTTILHQPNANKVVVDFNKNIGTHIDNKGTSVPTTRGVIHHGKRGVHIVPSSPK